MYIYDGLLALDLYLEFRLRELDVQIPPFKVSGYGHGNVDILDCLGPFVGELALLVGLFGLELGVGFFALGGRG